MATIGISIRIDVTKIDKEKLYKGAKGTYLDLTTFVNTSEKDKYDNNGFVSQSTTAEERAAGIKTPILGNVKVFFGGDDITSSVSSDDLNVMDLEEDVPF